MMGSIAVVDRHNRFVRWADRTEVHGEKLPHRSVHVLVFDSRGRLLVQQRRADKLTWPSAWDVSVAGHVEREDYPAGPDAQLDAVYASVAARELNEELGIDAPVTELLRQGPTKGVHYEHLRLYEAVWDGPIRIQEEEVADARWVAARDWPAFAAAYDVTPVLKVWVATLQARGRFQALAR